MEYSNSHHSGTQNNVKLLKSSSLAEISLKYRAVVPYEEMPMITSPQEAVEVLRTIWDMDKIQLHEEFVVLLLNTRKRCLGWSKISSGGTTATIVDPSAIFQVALLSNAASIILAHNHPSGILEASRSDKNITDRIVESGKMLGINVEDHIILTADFWLSFAIKGLI